MLVVTTEPADTSPTTTRIDTSQYEKFREDFRQMRSYRQMLEENLRRMMANDE